MTESVSERRTQVVRNTRTSRIAAAVSVVVLLVLLSVPFWASSADMRLIVEVAYFLALAQMWNLLAGYAGLVSIGQQAFVGLGGYMLFMLAIYFNVHPILAVALTGLIVAVIAVPTAMTVFRLNGAYFAIGTWVVAEVFRLVFAQITALGGGSGQSLPAMIVREIGAGRSEREMIIYFTALALALGAIAFVYLLLRSRHGLSLTAMRDSPEAADSMGIDIFRTKLMVYVAVAGITGMIGALIFLQKLRISPDAAFSVNDWTVAVIFIVVIGGIGTIEGPILGTLIYFLLRGALAQYGTVYLIVLGVVAIVIMLRAPQGLWGLAARKWGLYLFPVHRRLHMPD